MEFSNSTWQQQLTSAFNNINDLCQYLNLSADELPILTEQQVFPIKVPRSYVDCIERGNPNDPLLRQILPMQQELIDYPGFSSDPVGDLAAIAGEGVIHKYHGRALLITTGACAINCRYCFRRNFPYSELQLTPSRQAQALSYIAADPSLTEIILSGGDPLLLNDDKLADLLGQLDRMTHIKRIRIHSRLPVVLPARITPALIDVLAQSEKQLIVVLHANHGHELSPAVEKACKLLKNHDITLLNQSVLLKGVNDSVMALCNLSEKLFAIGVLPYYLHVLDKANGTGHFEVGEDRALLLMEQVKRKLPGYLIPKLVREVAGKPYKITLF